MISKIVEQAKVPNMTMQEIYDLAKKEGLNVGELKKAGETGIVSCTQNLGHKIGGAVFL